MLQEDPTLERYVVTARLKPGAAGAAEELLSEGPPFDPREAGLSAHAAYLSEDGVFLVFEGDAAQAKALRLANTYMAEVSRWQNVVADLPAGLVEVPADARCLYRWPADRSS
jgi:hypothetical protein